MKNPLGCNQGVQQLNREEVIVMTIGELIGLASTVLALPGSTVAVSELGPLFKPGHGRPPK